jgi:rare lipoprotein A
MSSIHRSSDSQGRVGANRIRRTSSNELVATARPLLKLFAVALSAAALSACVQTPYAGQKFASRSEPVETRSEPEQVRPKVAARPVISRKRFALASVDRPAASTRDAATGLASFYRHGTKTASGEKFDPGELTAAHRTLPFGTRLRVTNVTTGRSVTVRVNDRGPFIPGRVVDVSHGAAEALGMTGAGLAKVKLDVVQ